MKNINIDNLKLELIKRFIKLNNRYPEDDEVNTLLNSYNISSKSPKVLWKSTDMDLVLNQSISTSLLNEDINNIYYNIYSCYRDIEKLWNSFSNHVTDSINYYNFVELNYNKLYRQTTELLLNNNQELAFQGSVIEDFSSLITIDFPETDSVITTEGASSKIDSWELIDNISNINSFVSGGSSILSHKISGDLSSVNKIDGNYYLIETMLSNNKDDIKFVVRITLRELVSANLFKLAFGGTTNFNVSCYISNNDTDYKLIETINNVSGILTFNTLNEFKYIKFYFKPVNLVSNDDGIYSSILKLDSLQLYNCSYATVSYLYSGPYTFLDIYNEDVLFNYVKTFFCETIRENSNIEHYLSADNINWIPLTTTNGESSLVSLNSSSTSSVLEVIDSSIDMYFPIENNTTGITLEENEIILNAKIPISYLDKINSNSLTIFRNKKQNNVLVFNLDSGWFLENEDEPMYSIYIDIQNLDGITLDLGPTSAYLNNVIISNQVVIPYGVHKFSTNQANYYELNTDLFSELEFENNDILYPYNHKYLIEGYSYSTSFLGQRVYNRVGQLNGKKIYYKEYNDFLKSDSLEYFSIKNDDNYIYIIVKTYKSYSDWMNELFSITLNLYDNLNTEVYIKTIFNSYDNKSFSTLRNFLIKVG